VGVFVLHTIIMSDEAALVFPDPDTLSFVPPVASPVPPHLVSPQALIEAAGGSWNHPGGVLGVDVMVRPTDTSCEPPTELRTLLG
jgi:hypothetical protein